MKSGTRDAKAALFNNWQSSSMAGKVKLLAGASIVVAALLLVSVGAPHAAGTFSPTFTFKTSTKLASAHPDLEVTVDNPAGSENLKGFSLALPNGFWGSLASSTKCPATATQVANGTVDCDDSAQIGTVTTAATVESSNVRIRGEVYLADAAAAGATAAAADPASIVIVIHPKVGAVTFDNVNIAARAQVRYGHVSPTTATGAVGAAQGITTVVDNIPQSVHSSNYGTVGFHIDKVTLDLRSELANMDPAALGGPTPALLTNASSCGTFYQTGPTPTSGPAVAPTAPVAAVANFSGYSGSTAITSSNYASTGCTGSVASNPQPSFTLGSSAAGTTTNLNTHVDFGTDTGSGVNASRRIELDFPAWLGPNFPAFTTRCPTSSAPLITSNFDPSSCPAGAQIGTVTARSPLISQPLKGKVWLIEESPLPWIAIDISPTTDANNPKGVTIRALGFSATEHVDPSCVEDFCQSHITATFSNLPDTPLSSVDVNVYGTDPTGPGNFFTVAAANSCQNNTELAMQFTNQDSSNRRRATSVPLTGCDSELASVTSGLTPLNKLTTDSVNFGLSATAGLTCAFDSLAALDPEADNGCTTPYPTSPRTFTAGVHSLFVTDGSKVTQRMFTSNAPVTVRSDTTPPVTTITSGPAASGTSTSATPQFGFSSNDATASYTCAIDDSAFLPCSSPFTTPSLTTGASHTFEVRATDSAGNPDLTAAARTFTVAVPFAPTLTVTPSTTGARQHPSLDVSLSNSSAENIKDLKLSMPDGFFGGLTGVAQTCTVAQATTVADPITHYVPAPSCPLASKVGTVSTHAVVLSDDGVTPSDVNVNGEVYLTDGFSAGEPAGLLISVRAKISSVDLGYINVPIHLAVRDHALGIDTLAFSLPKSITSVDGTTNFQLRDLDMHIDTGPGAPQPLLTNPSYCGPAAFNATFTGYSSSSASSSSPFQVTGCDGLSFNPVLGASFVDATTGGPPGASVSTAGGQVTANFSAALTADPAGAGIKSTTLLMPKPVGVNPLKIPLACLPAQLAVGACPAASVVGTASASTPLLATPLTGLVYMLNKTGGGVPDLIFALRGPINVDITASNNFVNGTQLQTTINTLPDAPITSFSVVVNGFLSTRNETCDYPADQWNMTGSLSAFNGKTSGVNVPFKFNCPQAYGPIFSAKVKNAGKPKKTTLAISAKAQSGKKLKKLTLSLPKGWKFNKKSFSKKLLAKKVLVKGDGKKLKTKCFKLKNTTTFEVNLCKKQYSAVTMTFRAGAFAKSKKAKSPKFKLKIVDSANKSSTATQT
jgi:hypothetical protein